jgi:hypothetical protein
MKKIINLDLSAAEAAQEIIDKTIPQQKAKATDVENLVTKTLGILQENGVYAALLYLYAQKKNSIARETRERLLLLTSELGFDRLEDTSASSALKFLTDKVCCNLDKLLLVKHVWEQTLIYTRYGAKARDAEGDGE